MTLDIGIIGAGYVGTACELGFSALPNANVSVYDKFKPTESIHSVVGNSDILFICVPTPMREDGACDTSIVAQVVDQVCEIADEPKCIVIKSTVTPGTTETLQAIHPEHSLIFNPEFLTEANFVRDFCEQENIIIGLSDSVLPKHHDKIVRLYELFIRNQKIKKAKLVITHASEAEMTKYTVNCFLASKVSFFNEIHEICQASGIDFSQVRELATLDKRIGESHNKVPGPDGKCGFGGACLIKDLSALICFSNLQNADPVILASVWHRNLYKDRPEKDWEQITGATHKKAYGDEIMEKSGVSVN